MKGRDIMVLLFIIGLGVGIYRIVGPFWVSSDKSASFRQLADATPKKRDTIPTSPTSIDERNINPDEVKATMEEIAKMFPEAVSHATSTLPKASSSVEILATPTGFLNVRNKPSRNGSIVAKVTPGEVYAFTDQQNGWYRIILEGHETAWVLGTYVKQR